MSMTVCADSFIATTAIEVKQRRFVATGDVKGLILHYEQKDFTFVKFINEQVNTLCDIDESYEQHVEYEGKNATLNLMLSKELCGTATVAIIWYETLTNTLINDGFKLNPHDLCVTNKIFNRKK